ncbi:hypothetical protein Pcinc_034005 [Petrolisthes cinctipes]|uniref:Uncharacterized protein n=1 Tax=Petrolisthes cinctipes TaxID=88211 RepID=A0AAE1JXJ7_PETCI|nr:hypothetical protein Pcinc_034005 [Petrolisthes cinctipes]
MAGEGENGGSTLNEGGNNGRGSGVVEVNGLYRTKYQPPHSTSFTPCLNHTLSHPHPASPTLCLIHAHHPSPTPYMSHPCTPSLTHTLHVSPLHTIPHLHPASPYKLSN